LLFYPLPLQPAETAHEQQLLPPDVWQQRAIGLLEQRGVPWQLRESRLLACIDGEWVRVER
jgi:hypothetical protein